VPSMLKREPWHGQSKVDAEWLKATEQPRCEQFCANTSTLPWVFTTKPPNARSPWALSPPPLAMMNAELGEVGARIFCTAPSASWSMGTSSGTVMGPFVWPLGGAGQKKTRIGSMPVTANAVRIPAIHHPMKVRRVTRLGAAASVIRPKF